MTFNFERTDFMSCYSKNEGFRKRSWKNSQTLTKWQPQQNDIIFSVTMIPHENPTDGILYFLIQFSKISVFIHENLLSLCVWGLQYHTEREGYIFSASNNCYKSDTSCT